MVAGMVEQFRNLQSMLSEKIEHYESVEFHKLDAALADVFEAIYKHTPRNAQEAEAIIGLFLDIIANNDAGDNLRLIERVRAIINGCVEKCASMEIVHGAGI